MSKQNELRIGLTMRVVEATGYVEPRDALAHDWYGFMKETLPEVRWISVPNIRGDVTGYIKHWGLNGFILTGGNDLYDAPERDETELTILDYARNNNLSVLGVCRGLQLICHYFNQEIINCPEPKSHVATTHLVNLANSPYSWNKDKLMVNSYHGKCIDFTKGTTNPLIPFVFSSDGFLEGVWDGKNILGIMWHPERESPSSSFDKKIIRNHFSLEE